MFKKIMDKAIRKYGFEDKRTIIICTVCEKIADALKWEGRLFIYYTVPAVTKPGCWAPKIISHPSRRCQELFYEILHKNIFPNLCNFFSKNP